MADKASGHDDHGHAHDEHEHGHDDHGHGPQGPKVPVIVVPASSIEDSILRSISLVAFALLFAIVGFWRLSTEALPTPQVIEHGADHGGEHGAAQEHGPATPATEQPPAASSLPTTPAATPPAGTAPATIPAH